MPLGVEGRSQSYQPARLGLRSPPAAGATVSESRNKLLGYLASLAYIREGIPEGRDVRWQDDSKRFSDPIARAFLEAAVSGNVGRTLAALRGDSAR